MKKETFTLSALAAKRKRLSRVVLAGGAFDILHKGHVEHLENAKKQGDVLVVHVVGNKRVREKKGPGKPVMDEKERALIISALKSVDYVFIYNGRHYDEAVLRAVRPDVLYFNQEGYTPEIKKNLAARIGKVRLIVDKVEKKNSSSKIIEGIKKNGRRKRLPQ